MTVFTVLAGLSLLLMLKYAFEHRLVCNGILMAGAFYVGIALLIICLMALLWTIDHIGRKALVNVGLMCGSFLISSVALEVVLRVTETGKAYIENRAGCYLSAFTRKSDNIQRTYAPHSLGHLISPEFSHERQRNNFGFSDGDFFPKTDSVRFLIQTYGDSFTEGDGAPAESSYPALLRTLFNAQGVAGVTIQNFGICGNHPAFCLIQFEETGRH